MRTFIDSQLLIGLLNPKDVFHDKAREIVKSKNVFLLEAVKKEVRGSFLRKYNQACIKILKIVNKIRLSDLKTPEEILEFAEKELEKLIRSDEKLENFYRFVFDLIKDKITDKNKLIEIPTFLDDYGVELTTSISKLVKVVIVNIDEQKLKTRNEIYRIIQDVDFKQFRDLEIFCEAVAHALEEEAELLIGDKEFYEKALIALDKLKQHGYDPKLKIEYIKP